MFKFTCDQMDQPEAKVYGKVNVNYTTFWNDFSHYSLYDHLNHELDKGIESPFNYSDLSLLETNDYLFMDPENFIDTFEPAPIGLEEIH